MFIMRWVTERAQRADKPNYPQTMADQPQSQFNNGAMAWGTPSPGAPGLDALWHRLWRSLRYYADRLLSTYAACLAELTVHDEKMH